MNIEIEIPVNAAVTCTDGLCGTSTHVILDPRTRRLTHLVVREKAFPHADHLVPVTLVEESTPHFVRLRATSAEVAACPAFTETEFVPPEQYPSSYPSGSVLVWPGMYPMDPMEGLPPVLTVEHELTEARS
ncbi:MAG TPA: hypothetical protein VHS99_26820 [Chloroflexota bacterium]|nr:hypothetical protein [Chloroflexota bacterium]